MYRLLCFQIIIVSLLMIGGLPSCARLEDDPPRPEALFGNSPANTSYLIENDWVQLAGGFAEWPAAPGSASKVKLVLFGETTFDDLNRDTYDDAVVFVTYNGGGSGTFYYIAVAFQENGEFTGTNGILLGDRICEPSATVQNGLITVEYLDRNHNEPMAAVPSVKQTRYFILDNSRLREIKPAANNTIYQGWLTIGHEVRTYLPCETKDDLWLMGNSPAMGTIKSSHTLMMAGFPPYTPVFTILSGRKTATPSEGFGADYKGAFSASQYVHAWSTGNCKSDLIMLYSPLPGTIISSPLTISGRARGTWFFEGDFPIILEDGQGNNIAVSYATAKEEWMTSDFVEFEGVLEFNNSYSGQRGNLILKKANPTGKAQFDNGLKIPVNF